MTIGDIAIILKKIRVTEGLSQEQLANKLNVSAMSIHSYEHNKRKPSMKFYPKLIKLYPDYKDEILGVYDNAKDELKGEHEMIGEPQLYTHLLESQQNSQRLIDLQQEKIAYLEEQLKYKQKHIKPAYHFKIVGKYVQKTNTWYAAKIYGDISMLGYDYDEMNDILSKKGNPNSFINRYHPDSYQKLHESEYWKKTKSNFHHCSWEHMMWRSKSGQYVCLNIDMMYDRKEETVTTLFYYVNGDGNS